MYFQRKYIMFVEFSFCSLNFPCFWKYIKVNQDPKNSVEYFSEGKLSANSSDHFLPTLGNKCANRYGDYADGKKIKFKWVYYSFFDRFICFRVIIHSAEKLFGTYRWPERKNYTNYDVLFYWMVIDKLVAILFLLLPFNINSNFLAKWSLFRSLFTVSEQFRWITPAPSLFHYDIKFTSGVFQNFLCFFLVYIDIMANGIEYAVFMCVWNAWKSVWLTLVIYKFFYSLRISFRFLWKEVL